MFYFSLKRRVVLISVDSLTLMISVKREVEEIYIYCVCEIIINKQYISNNNILQ